MHAFRQLLTMPNQLLQGALLILLGEALLSLMGAIIKHLSSELPTELIVFYRNLFGIFMLTPLLMRNGLHTLKTQRLGLHILRACLGLTAMYGFFYVIANLPLAEAFLVKLTTPFFLPIIGALWLAERITRHNLYAILIGFVGVVFILQPGTDNFTPIALVGLGAAFLAGATKICIRKMGNTESSVNIVFYFAVISTILSTIPMLLAGQWPESHHWPWILALGLVATLGQLALTRAYRIANPGQIGPYVYSSVVYGAALGWFIWGEPLQLTTIIGSAFIIVAGVWNIRRKNVPS